MKKTCSICNNLQPLYAFYKKENGLHGRDSRCKQCVLQLKKQKYNKKNLNNSYQIYESGLDHFDQNVDVVRKFVEFIYG